MDAYERQTTRIGEYANYSSNYRKEAYFINDEEVSKKEFYTYSLDDRMEIGRIRLV